MNKGYIYGIGTALAGLSIAFLVSRNKKNTNDPDNLDLAGAPDQLEKKKEKLEQLENAKMVSEGSQFGVQYYNEAIEEEEELATSDET